MDPKVTYSDHKETYSDLKVTYSHSDPKVTYSDPKGTIVTLHTSPYLHLPPLATAWQLVEKN